MGQCDYGNSPLLQLETELSVGRLDCTVFNCQFIGYDPGNAPRISSYAVSLFLNSPLIAGIS